MDQITKMNHLAVSINKSLTVSFSLSVYFSHFSCLFFTIHFTQMHGFKWIEYKDPNCSMAVYLQLHHHHVLPIANAVIMLCAAAVLIQPC